MTAGEKPRKMFYTMGEVSEMFDVKPSLLRFWEGKFDILRPQKNKKGNRLFTPEDVRNLKVIYHLVKERGMTLAGAEKYMKASRRQIERDMELAERLQSIRALLAEVRDSLGDEDALPDGVFDDYAVQEQVGILTAGRNTDPEPESEPEAKPEPESETLPKQTFVEQTLFDF